MPSKRRYREGFRNGVFVASFAFTLTAMLAHLSTWVTGHGSYGTATAVIAVAFVFALCARGGER